MNELVRSIDKIVLTSKDGATLRETDFSVTLSTINPTRSGLRLKASLRRERPSSNCLNHVTGCVRTYVTQPQCVLFLKADLTENTQRYYKIDCAFLTTFTAATTVKDVGKY
jgi:hypothetical protein